MAHIEPFRALRYDVKRIDSIADVLAPPYDVISEAMRRALYARNPYNFVRLEYGTDGPEQGRYAQAAHLLREWRESGVLIEDAAPAYYLYEQCFHLPDGVHVPFAKTVYRRRGLFAATRLEPWGNRVFPHERTFAAPKRDRMKLLATCRANLSPVFGIVSDPNLDVEKTIGKLSERETPLFQARDALGEIHTLWRIDRPDQIAQIRCAVEHATITIADGHHRYETALAYRDQLKAASDGWDDEHPANFVLMTLVSEACEDLVILPIHRVVLSLDARVRETFTSRLNRFFDVTRHAFTSASEQEVRERLVKRLQTASATSFGVYLGGDAFLELRLRADAPVDAVLDSVSPAVRGLDVVRLHAVLLKQLLGIDTDDADAPARVAYTISASSAMEQVRSGTAALAVFVRPTSIEEIERVARAGETMPQKSTYFYPKLPSGLVARRVG